MKVKVIKVYNDKELKRLININEELNVTDARGVILINAKVAVEVPTPTTEVATKPAPKKAVTRKKKTEVR